MNTKTKRRMVVVTGIIVMVLILVLALVGGQSSAKTISIAEAATGDYGDQKVKVSGNVVDNSFETKDNVLTFAIYDPDGDMSQQVNVRYVGGVSATFGNGISAICTGRFDENGVLNATDLVTKCPSKYENATEALGVTQLLGYGDEVIDKPVKITGLVKAGTLTGAQDEKERFVLVDPESGATLPIYFKDALSEEIGDETTVVVTGSLLDTSRFEATDVAIAR